MKRSEDSCRCFSGSKCADIQTPFTNRLGTFEHDVSYRPPLGPAVLKPGFDLRVCHLQAFGQGCPLGAGQVLLPVEAFLQLADLHSGEGGPGLFSFWRRPVLVRVSYPPRDRERHQSCCRKEKCGHAGE